MVGPTLPRPWRCAFPAEIRHFPAEFRRNAGGIPARPQSCSPVSRWHSFNTALGMVLAEVGQFPYETGARLWRVVPVKAFNKTFQGK